MRIISDLCNKTFKENSALSKFVKDTFRILANSVRIEEAVIDDRVGTIKKLLYFVSSVTKKYLPYIIIRKISEQRNRQLKKDLGRLTQL